MKTAILSFIASIFFISPLFTVEIQCTLPGPNFYRIKADPYFIDVDQILTKVFQDENYSVRYEQKYSIFRVFYNMDQTKTVEMGFPNYIGIRYYESKTVDRDYFIKQTADLFGGFQISSQEIISSAMGNTNFYRTKPRLFDGKKALFDNEYAGDGLEMQTGWSDSRQWVFIKFIWHVSGQKELIANKIDVRQMLQTNSLFKNDTIIGIEECYYISSDSWFTPGITLKTSKGDMYYIDVSTGDEVKKYRMLTGR